MEYIIQNPLIERIGILTVVENPALTGCCFTVEQLLF